MAAHPALNSLLLFTCILAWHAQTVKSVGQEGKLVEELFLKNTILAEANRIVRPPGTNSPDGPVHVGVGYNLVSITGFDELRGYISALFWETAMWTDTRLSWNRSEYPDVTNIKVPSKYIWLPDVTLYSTGYKEAESGVPEEKVMIDPSGLVYFVPKRIISIKCDMNIRDFPFDTQVCQATHGSWVHHGNELNLTSTHAGLDNYHYHQDWSLLNFNLTKETVIYDCCPEPYQSLVMTLEIQRNSKFYFCIFVAPMIALYFILPAIHLFPPTSSQKTTIAGLMLLSTIFLHSLLYQQISGFAEEKAPKLVRRYQSLMAMTVISIGVSSLTATLASASYTARRVPSVLRKVMNSILGKICCFEPSHGAFTLITQNTSTPVYTDHDMTPIVDEEADEQNNSSSHKSALNYLTDELKHARERRQLELEWYQLAIFVDRFTGLLYIPYLIISIIVDKAH
ncbi:neuronal acetylcholine receptor subunit alpha-10-like [Watersipora subatra]|uniref:neuronal acetylcholine receptor subunit alpha-10-like n=1 Tax=Watersipora subatra TaxID=2589382 RepID=UPI00355AE730